MMISFWPRFDAGINRLKIRFVSQAALTSIAFNGSFVRTAADRTCGSECLLCVFPRGLCTLAQISEKIQTVVYMA